VYLISKATANIIVLMNFDSSNLFSFKNKLFLFTCKV
jgi:hypothetical protein